MPEDSYKLYALSLETLALLDRRDLEQTVHTLHSVLRAPPLVKVLPRGAIFGMDPSKEVGQ